MKTAQQILDIALSLMDERLVDGSLSTDDTALYAVNTPFLLNQLQTELLRDADYYKTLDLSFNPIKAISGGFHVRTHTDEDINFLGNELTKAYYFEVDDDATVYVEDYTGSWNTLETITATSESGFTAYKGIVTPTANATKSRIRFSGDYYYNYRNTALYSQPFATDDKVPEYRGFRKVSMASDFGILVDHIKEQPNGNYVKSGNFKWENNNTLFVNHNYSGSIRMNYKPIPVFITILSETLSLDDYLSVSVLPYGLAAKLLIHEDLTKADYFEQKYQEALFKIKQPKPANADDIVDVYGGF